MTYRSLSDGHLCFRIQNHHCSGPFYLRAAHNAIGALWLRFELRCCALRAMMCVMQWLCGQQHGTAAPRECRQHEEGLLLHRAIFGTWCDPGDGTLCVLPCNVSMGCEAYHRDMVEIMNFEEAAKVRWVGRKERRDKE